MSSRLAVVAAFLLSGTALAHPSHDHGNQAPPAVKAEAATAIPDTYPLVVEALRERATATETALDAARIADVHRAAKNLTDLAAALPAKAGDLSTEAQATIATTAGHLERQVAKLVASANDANLDGARTALVAVRADVDVLAGLVE